MFAGWCVMIVGVHTQSHIIMIAGFALHGFGIHTAVPPFIWAMAFALSLFHKFLSVYLCVRVCIYFCSLSSVLAVGILGMFVFFGFIGEKAMHAYRVGESHGDSERIQSDTTYSSLTFLLGTIGGVVTGPLLLSMGMSVPVVLAGGAGLNTLIAVYVGLFMTVSESKEQTGEQEQSRRVSKPKRPLSPADARAEEMAPREKTRKYRACTVDILSILFADFILQFTASAYNVSHQKRSY